MLNGLEFVSYLIEARHPAQMTVLSWSQKSSFISRHANRFYRRADNNADAVYIMLGAGQSQRPATRRKKVKIHTTRTKRTEPL